MPFSINLLCAAGVIDSSHEALLEHARDCGFDGVEIPVLSGEPEHYAALGRRLDALGLRRTLTAIGPPEADSLVADDAAARRRGRRHLEWVLDCADALGAETIGGPFHAPLGHFTGRGATEEELERAAEAHRAMAERAEREGRILALEPLNRFETYFLNTMEQARAYAERVDRPAFRIMYDTFHAHIEERDPLAALRHVAPRLGVVHLSENDRGIPGTGQVDFAAVFDVLDEIGHEGWIVVEAFGDAVPELAAATRVWRPLFPDLPTLFEQSAAFVRRRGRSA